MWAPITTTATANDLCLFLHELFQEGLSDNTSPCVHGQLHLADLLVDILHELDYEIHNLVLEHRFSVEVGNQEGNVITL